jgi:hypothetical protein
MLQRSSVVRLPSSGMASATYLTFDRVGYGTVAVPTSSPLGIPTAIPLCPPILVHDPAPNVALPFPTLRSSSRFLLDTRPSQPLLTPLFSFHRNEKLLADPVRLRQISERIPAGRWGDPRDFAGPVVFLASNASQYVCGELLVVDGVSPDLSAAKCGGIGLRGRCGPLVASTLIIRFSWVGWVGKLRVTCRLIVPGKCLWVMPSVGGLNELCMPV